KPDRAIDIDELRSSELHSGIMVDILKGRAKDSTGGKPEGGKIRDAELTIEEARNAIGASLKAALAGVRASSPPTGGLNQPGAPNTPILREKTKKTAGDGIGGGV
ncbi:MAG: hypothetical protein LBU15_03495, partial [Rickettsiales bacterium]|nr:hypothetical protein [Rickettsiales bacterium]